MDLAGQATVEKEHGHIETCTGTLSSNDDGSCQSGAMAARLYLTKIKTVVEGTTRAGPRSSINQGLIEDP